MDITDPWDPLNPLSPVSVWDDSGETVETEAAKPAGECHHPDAAIFALGFFGALIIAAVVLFICTMGRRR